MHDIFGIEREPTADFVPESPGAAEPWHIFGDADLIATAPDIVSAATAAETLLREGQAVVVQIVENGGRAHEWAEASLHPETGIVWRHADVFGRRLRDERRAREIRRRRGE